MATQAAQQPSSSVSKTHAAWFLPTLAVSGPCVCGLVCFVSGLLGSAILAVLVPSIDEESDLRSFVSFAIGAVVCYLFTKKFAVDTKKKKMSPEQEVEPADKNCVSIRAPPGLCVNQLRSRIDHAATPVTFAPPPGLASPACDLAPWRQRARPTPAAPKQAPTPAPVISETPLPYSPQTFRKDVMAIMRELAYHRNVAVAVRQVRARNVPVDRQAAELADILTYALEEARGTVRRTNIAFIGGLTGAFDNAECIKGVQLFFDTVYNDLCEEVPKLQKLIKTELLPTLSSVLSAEEVAACVPDLLD